MPSIDVLIDVLCSVVVSYLYKCRYIQFYVHADETCTDVRENLCNFALTIIIQIRIGTNDVLLIKL